MSVVRAHVGEPIFYNGVDMLISDISGYKLYCETRKLDIPAGHYHVRVFTTYEWAKDPEAEQNKMELFLTPSELEKLRQSLTA